MEMALRAEIFPDDLDATVGFYTGVLGFRVTADQRAEPSAYVSLQRGSVRIGAARGQFRTTARDGGRPPGSSWCSRLMMSLASGSGC